MLVDNSKITKVDNLKSIKVRGNHRLVHFQNYLHLQKLSFVVEEVFIVPIIDTQCYQGRAPPLVA